ncbi:MAG: hypothetical protein ACYC6O_04075 [Thermoleophilia bacterium]
MKVKRLMLLLSLSVISAALLTLSLSMPTIALGYTTSAAASTGAEVALFAVGGTGLLIAGIMMARMSRR